MSELFFGKFHRGFPEWLPGARRREQDVMATIRRIYESYGYTPIETCAVEKVEALATSGDVSKEIFGIHRLAAATEDREGEFGLHFDLTLPFARYTADNYANLQFPFKRYQQQKVWRGEKAQSGRYREFYQSDIDIVGDGELPLHYEAEVVQVLHDIFEALQVGDFVIRINNRKLLDGLYRQQGINEFGKTLIAVDKIDKIGKDGVTKLLLENGLSAEQAAFCVDLASRKYSLTEAFDFLASLDTSHEIVAQAKLELDSIFKNLAHLPAGRIRFDLSIARGLDYYTGSVYECNLVGLEQYGSVCSGGRYDNLASKFTERKLPGVGLSIGVSRLLYILFESGRLAPLPATPTEVMVLLFDENQRPLGNQVAAQLRATGLRVETTPSARKFGKQIQFAEKRGARLIVMPEADGSFQMKNLVDGTQGPLDVEALVKELRS